MKKSFFRNSLSLCFPAFLAVASLVTSRDAQAGASMSVMQTANVLPSGDFEIKAQADIIFNSNLVWDGVWGFNLSPHFRAGIIEHYLDVDAYVGTGTTDFQLGALAKFNLLPDLPDQLGVSFIGGVAFLRDQVEDASVSGTVFRLGVLTSKTVEASFGQVTPYLGYEFEVFVRPGPTGYPNTLFGGARWEPNGTKPWTFYSELSIGLHDSIFALSVGAGQVF